MWYLYLKSNYIIVFSNYNSEKTLLGERGLLEEHIAKCSSIWGKSCSKVYFILYLKYHLKEFGERRRDRILILSSNFWTLKQSKRLKKIWFKKKKGISVKFEKLLSVDELLVLCRLILKGQLPVEEKEGIQETVTLLPANSQI